MSRTFKHYTIERPVGRGGMAEVFLATDTRDNSLVALKLVHEKIANEESFRKRFHHEYDAHVGLDHPNIVRVFDGPEHEGQLFMAVEFIDGFTLLDFYHDHGKVPPPLAAYLLHEVLQGLAYIHGQGTIHRDIKPANIMFSKATGEVKIADFGIVKKEQQTMLTQAGEIIGTPAFMSPEQAMGKKVDHRTDIYSTGVLIYEILAGENPFMDPNIGNVIMKVIKANYPQLFELAPEVPDNLNEVVSQMMARDLNQRVDSCEAALALLKPAIDSYGEMATQDFFRTYVGDPEAQTAALRRALANQHAQDGLKLARSPKTLGEGLIELQRCLRYESGHAQARPALDKLAASLGLNLTEAERPGNLASSEKELERKHQDYDLTVKVAQAHQKQKNFFEAVRYWRKALAIRPADRTATGQLLLLRSSAGVSKGALAQQASVGSGSGLIRKAGSSTSIPAVGGRDRKMQPKSFKSIRKKGPGARASKSGNIDISQFGQSDTGKHPPASPGDEAPFQAAPAKSGGMPLFVALPALVVVGMVAFFAGQGSVTQPPAPAIELAALQLRSVAEAAEASIDAGNAEAVLPMLQALANELPPGPETARVRALQATAHEKLGQSREALSAWRLVNQQAADGPLKSKAVERVAELAANQQ